MEPDDSIRRTFYDRFERILNKTSHPNRSELIQVFDWLDSEGRNARSFDALNTIDELRREAESFFCQFKNLREEAEEKSKKVNKTLKERDEKLREEETNFELSTKGIK